MSLHIYNTLSRKKEEFLPLKEKAVKMYVCGPTVYDEPHIGHARSAYIFDVVRRYLTYRGYKVTFVRNVTDVDDKIIDKAKKEFAGEDLKTAATKVSQKYLDLYHKAMEDLGILSVDDKHEPKAMQYITKMISFIEILLKKGSAYTAEGDVYFDIKKARDYGKLSHQNLEKMESGARVAPGEKKHDPLDFALWKKAKEGEPSWQSPWGLGRPGWHIECSVMSSDILGDEFDIHAGGIDLIFPHHENEIAQSEGAGKKFARYWMHNGLLTINGEKMAKSLNNYVTVKDVLKEYPQSAAADILKIFFLQARYSMPIDFSHKKMEEAKTATFHLLNTLKKGDFDIKDFTNLDPIEKKIIDDAKAKFESEMDDDFNMPQALATIHSIERHCNTRLDEYNDGESPAVQCEIQYSINTIRELAGALGLSLNERDFNAKDPLWLGRDLREEIHEFFDVRKKIDERTRLRKEKKFKEADEIRKMLEDKGIILEDTEDGTEWRRKL